MVALILGLPPINRIELVGRVATDPKIDTYNQVDSKTGEEYVATRCSFAIQHYSGHTRHRKSDSLRVWVDAWGALARWLMVKAEIAKKDPVWVWGKLKQRPLRDQDRKGNMKGYWWSIRLERIYFIPDLPKAVRHGDQYLIPAAEFDRLSTQFNSGGPPEMDMDDFAAIWESLEENKKRLSKLQAKDYDHRV